MEPVADRRNTAAAADRRCIQNLEKEAETDRWRFKRLISESL
jgi:hypothetical protein